MFRSVLYGASVAFLLLALGISADRTSESESLAQLQDWADSQVVLQALTVPGLTSSHIDALVGRLEARNDVDHVEFRMDCPEWTGDPGLAQQWQALWNERAVALLEIWPDWTVLERTARAVEQWRDNIVQNFDDIRDVLLLSEALIPLSLSEQDEGVYLQQLARMRYFSCIIAVLACLAAFSAVHAAQDEFLRDGMWWTRGVVSLVSVIAVYWLARSLYSGGAASLGLKAELTVPGYFVFAGAILLLFVFDKSYDLRKYGEAKKSLAADGEDSQSSLK